MFSNGQDKGGGIVSPCSIFFYSCLLLFTNKLIQKADDHQWSGPERLCAHTSLICISLLLQTFFSTFVCLFYLCLQTGKLIENALPFCNVVFCNGQDKRGGIVCSCLICIFLLLFVFFIFVYK